MASAGGTTLRPLHGCGQRGTASERDGTIELSDSTTFVFGALGALVALLAVQGLPVFEGLARGWTMPEITKARAAGAVGTMLGFSLCGGVVAILIGGATETKHALAYGMGWQGFLGGYLGSPYRAAHSGAQSTEE